jgi:hypothetical protein
MLDESGSIKNSTVSSQVDEEPSRLINAHVNQSFKMDDDTTTRSKSISLEKSDCALSSTRLSYVSSEAPSYNKAIIMIKQDDLVLNVNC